MAGQEVTYDVTLVQLRTEGAVVAGKVTAADGRPVAEADIYFAHLDQSRSKQVFGDRNFVFSGELKHLLGLAKGLADEQESGVGGQKSEAR